MVVLFPGFATVWKFAAVIGKVPEADSPARENASLSTTAEVADRQRAAKKCNAIAFANLTMALDSPSLIGMLMRAQTDNWPSGLASMVMRQLFDKFKPQDTVSLIDMNQLKQRIGLQTPESNPQLLFEQMAALENQFKKTMDESEKVAIAREKLPFEYQPVLTVEMRKEGSLVTAQHIENAAFQHWWSFDGSYANNSVIDGASQDTKVSKSADQNSSHVPKLCIIFAYVARTGLFDS